MLFFILFLGGFCALGVWLYRKYTVLSRSGLRHGPAFPLFGDMLNVMLQKEHITDVLSRAYESFPEDRLVGRYEFLTPFVIVRDPELLKRITVKDFEHFVDRNLLIDSNAEPLFGRNLVSLKVDYIDLDAKDLTTRYANDVIATCAFGLEINSQKGDNEFYTMSKDLTTLTFSSKMRFLGYRIAPWLMAWLKVTIFPTRITKFFTSVVLGTMKQREEMNIHRPDMIHLLMEAKKGNLTHESKTTKDEHAGFATVEESDIGRTKNKTAWSDIDLVAQAVIFLFAGYDTVSTTMSFLLYELAVNPECQEKLVEEIRENEKRNNGKFDYNSVQHMIYLDMVVSEVLRKWPGAPAVDRLCVRDYNLGKANDKATEDVILRKGQAVQLPAWAQHRDPKYFPNPDKFDPERFSDENKHTINPVIYMPFGLGPRNCIGSRFALCEVKVMAYQLLLYMEVSPCEMTNIPLRLSAKDGFRMSVTGGNWLRLRARK